jgi:hypothetical protein
MDWMSFALGFLTTFAVLGVGAVYAAVVQVKKNKD